MAGSFEELVEKAREKLCIDDDISIILEEDGTVIDDWEIAQAFSEKPFMILTVARRWSPENATIFEECILRITDAEAQASQSATVEKSSHDQDSFYIPTRPTEPGSNILPALSPYVSKKLEDGRPFDVWAKFVEEMAYGLLSTRIMATRSDYEEVGQAVYRKYPCINLISKNPTRPWNAFVKSLSQKIRHIRWIEKKRTNPAINSQGGRAASPKSHTLIKRSRLHSEFGSSLGEFTLESVKLEKDMPACETCDD